MKNKLANLVLLASGLIFLGTYPFKDSNVGVALLMHMSGAAFIGGVADWYGVTALFHKPFGIGFKTAIIPRSKERIIELACDMVQNELLTSSNVYKGIKSERPLMRIVDFLLSIKGQKWINDCSEIWLLPLLESFSLEKATNSIADKTMTNVQIVPYLQDLIKYFLRKENSEKIWHEFHYLLLELVKSEELRPHIINIVHETKYRYVDNLANESGISGLLGMVASMAGPDMIDKVIDEKLVGDKIQQELISYIEMQDSINSTLGQYAYNYVEEWQMRLEKDVELQKNIENNKLAWANNIISGFMGKVNKDKVAEQIYLGQKNIKKYLLKIKADEKTYSLAERQILWWIASIMPKFRQLAVNITREHLSNYSANEMADVLETQVQNDLQIIRINGSLVGALLGGVFYLAAIAIQGVL